jgi:hypothetical protein
MEPVQELPRASSRDKSLGQDKYQDAVLDKLNAVLDPLVNPVEKNEGAARKRPNKLGNTARLTVWGSKVSCSS